MICSLQSFHYTSLLKKSSSKMLAVRNLQQNTVELVHIVKLHKVLVGWRHCIAAAWAKWLQVPQ